MLANEKTERTPDDLTRVNLGEEWQVDFWCAKFSVTPEGLRACVAAAGQRTEDIARRLRKGGHDSFTMGGED